MGVIDQVLGAIGGGAQGYTSGKMQQIALARQKMLDDLMMRAQGSEIGLRQAETLKNYRQASAPLPGTPEYLDYLLSLERGKGAIATDTAANTEARVGPMRVANKVAEVKGTTPIKVAGEVSAEAGKFPYQVGVASARAGLSPRAQAARAVSPEVDAALGTLSKYDEPGMAGRLFSKHMLGGYGISPEGQIANQAAAQLARAYLSRTGRNPTQQQIDAAAQQILVQPGEEGNATVIANKRALRTQWAQEVRTLGAPGANTGSVNTGAPVPKAKPNFFMPDEDEE